ncbi:hypothetical protein U6A24_17505 [Aquimarina gracilis]|uniref:Lipoprotein n=1 Tax=Aquimarina gracilis TaxID=874422 RepID=A0ABU5ZZK3_9FLAO|nr:hypothetical protein [Aquimarina gracilis]MEB3347276.1 hypothetical protein [Aquimarina gracilis]
MKNFKLKPLELSLMTLVVLSVIIVSCSKDEVITNEVETLLENQELSIIPEQEAGKIYLKPPKGFENKTDLEKQQFFDELSEKDANALEENYRISDFLKSKGLLEKAEASLKDGELLSNMNLNKLLSKDQLQLLNNHEVAANNMKNLCQYYYTQYCTIGYACDPLDFNRKRVFAEVCLGQVLYGYFCNINCN